MSRISKHLLFAVAFIANLSIAASANMVIDLDPKEGDQKVREAQVKPGEARNLELVAQKGAQDIEGFEIQLRFDPKNFEFKGFQPGGLMAGAIALPPQKTGDGVKISVGFLGRKSPGDAGSLGIIQIQVTQNFSGTAKISLIEGSFGAKGQTQSFPLNSEVLLTTGATKGAGGSPGGSPNQQNNQQPQTKQPPGQQPPGQQPPGQQPPGQQQQPGFQPPGQQKQTQGQPTAQQMAQMAKRWMQSPERADMNKDGKVDVEDFKIWFDQKNNQGGQNPPGQNNPPGGFQNPPGQNPQGGFQNQPQGHGGPPGQNPQGGGMGPQGHGGPPGQNPQGGGMGPQGGPMGDMGEPNPEELIDKLPKALQGTFKETWKFSERAHMEAELKSQEHILATLAQTKKYVAAASDEEKKQIGQVLMFFHMGGGEGGPGEHGMPGEHGSPMGQPQMPKDGNINTLIDMMIKDVTRDMAEIKKMLSTM